LSIFVDSSVWFAAASKRDRNNALAKSILRSDPDHVITDHILIETWFLLNSRFGRSIAEFFWDQLRRSTVRVEAVTPTDLETAWAIGTTFHDQDFSVVDRTSFAVMERLGIARVASFDHHFAVYRYGRSREKAFEIVSAGPSSTFDLFREAILNRKQLTLTYGGLYREVCPHILGHTGDTETALVFQFGGSTRGRLPSEGEWRCLRLSQVANATLRDGSWRSGSRHQTTQRCVDKVFIDVNEDVPNQPGRRIR
jgi:predicted nucleic acid-binding protein